jgi:hypothetical protein
MAAAKRNVQSISLNITNKTQRYTVLFITVNALHVSGGFSAHHQELKNCTHTHSIEYMSSLYAMLCVQFLSF